MSNYGDFALVYDRLTENVRYSERAGYIRTLFERYGVKNGADILDLACGTGTLTIKLADSYEMIGVDNSPEMLSHAQEKMYESEKRILFLCQDMTELDLYGTVDGAVCMLDSLNHLSSPDDIKKVIGKVGLFMNYGGIFIFDVNTIYKHRKILGNNTFVYDCDDVYCVWQNQLNKDDSVDVTLDIFEQDGDAYLRSGEAFTEIVCPVEDYKKWLKESEFDLIDIFDEMSDNPLSDTTERAVFVARYIGKKEEK